MMLETTVGEATVDDDLPDPDASWPRRAERAQFGEVVYTRPSPDELDEAAHRIEVIRSNLSVLRSEVENLERAWSPTPAHDRTFRDVEGLLTAALVLLYKPMGQLPNRATAKREKLAHPETYVIEEGFSDQRDEDGLVSVWWWDRYHEKFGPNLTPMPWREPNPSSSEGRGGDRG